MAAPRLLFLYQSPLWNRTLVPDTSPTIRTLKRKAQAPTPRAQPFSTRGGRHAIQQVPNQSYGSTLEMPPPPGVRKGSEKGKEKREQKATTGARQKPPLPERRQPSQIHSASGVQVDAQAGGRDAEFETRGDARVQARERREGSTATQAEAGKMESSREELGADALAHASESRPGEPDSHMALQVAERPLDRVLHMAPPISSGRDGNGHQRPPHLHAPPYVHHFDTYTLVNDLGKGGFSKQQSITMMKAVRGLLAGNLELAKESLVSKSDTENVGAIHQNCSSNSLPVTRTAKLFAEHCPG